MELLNNKKQKICDLQNYSNVKRSSFLESGDISLSFCIQRNNENYDDVIEENYIVLENQRYVIKNKNIVNEKTLLTLLECNLDLEELEGNILKTFNNQRATLDETMDLILHNVSWNFKHSQLTKRRNVLIIEKNILDIIQKISDVYNIKFKFDTLNHEISIRDSVFLGEKNIDRIEVKQIAEDSFDYATRLVPQGINQLNITDINDGKDYIENYQYSNKMKTIFWKDTTYSNIYDLKEDAEVRLEQLSKPKKEYLLKSYEIADTNEEKQENYMLGSKLILNKNKVKTEILTIVGMIEFLENPVNNLIILSNRTIHLPSKEDKLKEISNLITNAILDDGSINGAVISSIDVKQINGLKNEISNLVDLSQIINKLKAFDVEKADMKEINSINGNIKSLDIEKANIKDLKIANQKLDQFIANSQIIQNNFGGQITSLDAKFNELKANKADVKELHAVNGKIDHLTSETADIKQANIDNLHALKADIKELKAVKANINDLSVINGDIKFLKSDSANIKALLNGNLSSENIQSGGITSDRLNIENGFIKDAMIENVSINKILADYIDTNKLKLQSSDGSMEIVGSTQQFKDENGNVRIQMGKDKEGNFNFIIRDKDGKSVLIDENGIKSNAVPDGLIKNNMIANRGIEGNKINIASMVSELNNDNSSLIKSNRIILDEKEQTLDIAFNSMQTSIDDVANNVTYDVDIVSTNGSVFKNGQISTTLIAIVYHGAEDITDKIDESKFIWTRISNDKEGDIIWNHRYAGGRKRIVVTKDDVYNRATFNCEILQ